MRRLASLLVLLLAALLAPVVPAGAAPIGGLVIVPGESIDTAAIRVRTSGPCPAQADAIYASAKGSGFPSQGQVVAPNTAAGMSHSAGFDVYFAETMKDFAADNNTTLKGRYDITVFCIDSFTQNSFGEVTIHVVNGVVGIQGFPVTALRMASNAVMPFLRAVET
jgi:hypothetical protein